MKKMYWYGAQSYVFFFFSQARHDEIRLMGKTLVRMGDGLVVGAVSFFCRSFR